MRLTKYLLHWSDKEFTEAEIASKQFRLCLKNGFVKKVRNKYQMTVKALEKIEKDKQNKKSQYLGVHWDRRRSCWVARIEVEEDGKKREYSKGEFKHDQEKEAAKYYDKLALRFNRPTNFFKKKDASEDIK